MFIVREILEWTFQKRQETNLGLFFRFKPLIDGDLRRFIIFEYFHAYFGFHQQKQKTWIWA
jgi:hypothetical protein